MPRAKQGSIVPAGGKGGKWRWSGLISFVSRCIHFVFFPTSPLSVKALIRNWTPQWQIEPAIKGRKRKALLSAADWDPRLPSHMWGVCVCVRLCIHVCLVQSQGQSWHHHHLFSHFPHSPGVPTAYISALSRQQTKPNQCSCSPSSHSLLLSLSLSHTHTQHVKKTTYTHVHMH